LKLYAIALSKRTKIGLTVKGQAKMSAKSNHFYGSHMFLPSYTSISD